MTDKLIGIIIGILVSLLGVSVWILIEIQNSRNSLATYNQAIERVEKKIDQVYSILDTSTTCEDIIK